MLKTNIFILSIIVLFIFAFIFAFKVDGKNQRNNLNLRKSYDFYKENFVSQDGRIIDYGKNNITTSEGQSYMLLRSLIMNDREAFDLVYSWTKNNLQRNDSLFAWLWGKNSNGEYKILDDNSASDADIDIAFALILANERFNNNQYLQEAIPIIKSIWDHETKQIGNYLVLMPGVNQTSEEKIEINPSYFSPYAFRYFQKYDDLHDWNCLIDSSYYYLDAVMSKTQTHLPPNWFSIENGQIVLGASPKSDFSYDAVRVFARIYVDYIITDEQRALPILEKSNFFINKWIDSKKLYVNYKANGQLADKDRFKGSIAILVPVISLYDKKIADEIYDQELEPYFQSEDYWNNKHGYYSKNLSWLGYYFYNKQSKEYREMHKKRLTDY